MLYWADISLRPYLKYSIVHCLEVIAISSSLWMWVISLIKINIPLYICFGIGSFLDLCNSEKLYMCECFVFVCILVSSHGCKMTAPAGGITFVFKAGMRGKFEGKFFYSGSKVLLMNFPLSRKPALYPKDILSCKGD